MKEYDAEVRRVMTEYYLQSDNNNIECFGNYKLVKNGKVQSRLVQEAIRISDIIDTETKFVIKKYQDKHYLIDVNTRNVFKKGVSTALLKYIYRCNIYRKRDRSINKFKLDTSYLHYSNNETQKYIMK